MCRAVKQPVIEAASGEGHEVNTGLTATASANVKSVSASPKLSLCVSSIHETRRAATNVFIENAHIVPVTLTYKHIS